MTIKADPSVVVPQTVNALHFVGIGGSGMSGIARMFHEKGIRVTGSDSQDSQNVNDLQHEGIQVALGHDATNVGDVDALVVTGALWQDNPELHEARRRGITILHRSQALVYLVDSQRLVSVAGAHGKTTSTGMIVTALNFCGIDPSFVSGGVIHSLGTSSAHGKDPLFVIEADESDGSFLGYQTSVALITNVDPDHLDHYGSIEQFEDAFVEFANSTKETVVISADDDGAQRILGRIVHPNVLTFGESEEADVRLFNVVTEGHVTFSIRWKGLDYAARLLIPGKHNALNACGAFAVLMSLGCEPAMALEGIESFGGTKRRFELHETVSGVHVYDDYAHHPTEVDAVLSAARTVVGSGRIIAVHQPHLYSRTRIFAAEFAATLEKLADHTVILDVCGAREDPEPGVTGELVFDHFRDKKKAVYLDSWEKAAEYLGGFSRPGDFIITLGCGDVYKIIPRIVTCLRENSL